MAKLRVNTQRVSVGGGAYVLAMSAQSARYRQGPQRYENERTVLKARFYESLVHVKPVFSRLLSTRGFGIAIVLD